MDPMQVEGERHDSHASDGGVTDDITSSTVTKGFKNDKDEDTSVSDSIDGTGCKMETKSDKSEVENSIEASEPSVETDSNRDKTSETNVLISDIKGDNQKLENDRSSDENTTKTSDGTVESYHNEQTGGTSSETQGDEKGVGNYSTAPDSGGNESNSKKTLFQGGSKKGKLSLAFARKKRLEQHAMWILSIERKFQESKGRSVSEMTTSELMENLSRTEETIVAIDDTLRRIKGSTSFAKQKKALQDFSKNAPIFNPPAAEGNSSMPNQMFHNYNNDEDASVSKHMYAGVNVSVNAETTMSDVTQVRKVMSSIPGLRKPGKILMKKDTSSRNQQKRMQKLLKESRAAVVANRKRPFFRTFTALKELDRRQENDLVVVSQLRTIRNDPQDPDLNRYCLSCGKVLNDSQEVVKHLFEEDIGKEDISQLFAWESRNRCSFLGVFLNIYHKYFKAGSGSRIHCYFCGLILTRCSEIIDHLLAVHPLIFTTVTFELLPRCFVCWAKIHTTEALKSHYQIIHKIDDEDQMQTYISCNFYGDLWEQIIGDMEGQIIYCRLCDFKCAQGAKSLFVKHVRQVHSEKSSTDCCECRKYLSSLHGK